MNDDNHTFVARKMVNTNTQVVCIISTHNIQIKRVIHFAASSVSRYTYYVKYAVLILFRLQRVQNTHAHSYV